LTKEDRNGQFKKREKEKRRASRCPGGEVRSAEKKKENNGGLRDGIRGKGKRQEASKPHREDGSKRLDSAAEKNLPKEKIESRKKKKKHPEDREKK